MPGERRRSPTSSPRTATIRAAWSRPQRVIPPKIPTHHHRPVAEAQAIPQIPNTVIVCGHTPLAATLHTGVAKPKTTAASSGLALGQVPPHRQEHERHGAGHQQRRRHPARHGRERRRPDQPVRRQGGRDDTRRAADHRVPVRSLEHPFVAQGVVVEQRDADALDPGVAHRGQVPGAELRGPDVHADQRVGDGERRRRAGRRGRAGLPGTIPAHSAASRPPRRPPPPAWRTLWLGIGRRASVAALELCPKPREPAPCS